MTKLKAIIKARYLRKEETKAEKILWKELRNKNIGAKFRRQHPIDKFVLDFYAPKLKLGIELDGSSHRESGEYDKLKTEYLSSHRIKIIRFWNSEIENNLKEVVRKIRDEIV
jgi:very-short-patch-repair endonuclease